MVTVPFDIQLSVIELIYRSSQHAVVDYSTLCACALVCRAWTAPAQRLLFRRVPCGDVAFPIPYPQRAANRLLATLRDAAHLAEHVRLIFITLWSDSAYDASYIVDVALLERCPHVAGVVILGQLVGDGDFNPILEARLRRIPLRSAFLQVEGEYTMVERVVQMWPGVRVLSARVLDNEDTELVIDDEPEPPLQVHIPGTVETLSVHGSQIDRLLARPNFSPALRDLELILPAWTRADLHYLEVSGVLPRLETLRIVGRFPPPNVLAQLTRLDSLVISTLPAQSIALPQSLRRVAYHHDFPVEYAEGVRLLLDALRTLPSLQLVAVTPRSEPEVIATLRKVCSGGRVDFIVYEAPDRLQGPQHVDWI
ncbi:hypothetical protein FA95DRAFT_1611692 [Auriscalpium vulgare]|uniref:Uncharacterized protein n=1 Tax=Auriscalpium vulgare TaxID=40419 RepID=A0ACB8R8T6_9AGAM|nr:hypothetical protein FA95DRAFT_1611692 [Auriscalpium vulgare]